MLNQFMKICRVQPAVFYEFWARGHHRERPATEQALTATMVTGTVSGTSIW
jgi:hypothetical protein